MPLEFAQLTSAQIQALAPERTVFFFPVGPIEDHGPHLPVGADLSEAAALSRLAAERLERDLQGWIGVLMPSAPLGVEGNTTSMAITVRAHVLRDWLVDASRSLIRMGFAHFVCFSGHIGPRQLTAIEDAGKIILRRTWLKRLLRLGGKGPFPSLVSARSGLITAADVRKAPLWPDPLEHGGQRDTSIALALAVAEQRSVDPAFVGLPAVERSGSTFSRLFARLTRARKGYWGPAPSQATPESGQKTLIGTVDEVFPKLRAVWEGANPDSLFRSWYSILPPNKSFAVAWLLTFALLGLLLAWFYVFVQGIRVE